MPRDLAYENNNIAYDEQYTKEEGGGIKCKNYEVCNAVLPMWWYDCKGCYLCTNWVSQFATWSNPEYGVYRTGKRELTFADDIECPVCLEIKRCVSQFNCDHYICIGCFKRCYYGDDSGRPAFPYSDEVWEEYSNDRENPKWDIEYPLLRQWDKDDDAWDEKHMAQFNEEVNLRKCPLCRQ